MKDEIKSCCLHWIALAVNDEGRYPDGVKCTCGDWRPRSQFPSDLKTRNGSQRFKLSDEKKAA